MTTERDGLPETPPPTETLEQGETANFASCSHYEDSPR